MPRRSQYNFFGIPATWDQQALVEELAVKAPGWYCPPQKEENAETVEGVWRGVIDGVVSGDVEFDPPGWFGLAVEAQEKTEAETAGASSSGFKP